MTYQVHVARTAARQLTERLPEAVAAAFAEFLPGPLAENPRRVGTPLHKPCECYWRARRGSTESGSPSSTAPEPSKFSTSATGGMPTADRDFGRPRLSAQKIPVPCAHSLSAQMLVSGRCRAV